jgi:glycosyltransferase involved in cell wall biosynthesis
LFAGNLGRAQGLETIIEAVDLLKKDNLDVNWVLLGEGTLKPWLTEEVNRRGLRDRVHFLPRRPPHEMPKALAAATGVLVTLGHDPVYAMTIPSKVQSSLAAGRPILAALAGEPARVVSDAKAGLVAAPENAQEFAKVVKDFFALPEKERSEMGARGHRYYAAHFTQDKVVTRIVELLEKMGHQ